MWQPGMPASQDRQTDGDDERRLKRQRTALACDSCRGRKTRCDGTRPSCGVCLDMGFDCLYPRPGRGPNASRFESELADLLSG